MELTGEAECDLPGITMLITRLQVILVRFSPYDLTQRLSTLHLVPWTDLYVRQRLGYELES